MKITNNNKTTAIALILVLTISSMLIVSTQALHPDLDEKLDTDALLWFRPNPIGVGQTLLVNAWVLPSPLFSGEIYRGYIFTFTKPNGQVLTVGPMNSETPATVWFEIVPDVAGTWQVKFEWPGDADHESCSVTIPLTVQQAAVPLGAPDVPLPTYPWTYPVRYDNRNWWQIIGNWYQSDYSAEKTDFNPYTTGPKSAHVLWKLPATSGIGGMVGGEKGSAIQYANSRKTISTVMAGRAYASSGGYIYCYDVRTGEELWSVLGSYNVGAVRGASTSATPALFSFGSTYFRAYDALTGAMILNMTTPSLSYFAYDHPYVYSLQNYTLGEYGARLIKWTTEGTTTNFNNRIEWNTTFPLRAFNWGWDGAITDNVLCARIRLENMTRDPGYYTNPSAGSGAESVGRYPSAHIIGLAFCDLTDGSWTTYPIGPDVLSHGPMTGASDGLYYFPYDVPYTWAFYDIETGTKAFDTDPGTYPWGNNWAYSCTAGYGMFYGLSYSGIYAFDMTDGDLVWGPYVAEDPWSETPYGMWPFGSGGAVLADGVLYAANTEHSPTLPYLRGWRLHAIDAWTGNARWTMLGYWSVSAVAMDTLFASELGSASTYAFAKGEVEVTVATSSKVTAKGSSILIEGTIMDQSPAQKGTPAIADEDMTAWMEYLHIQQSAPTDIKGVPVTIVATDGNGNSQTIGSLTSDQLGTFAMMWTPTTEGTYKINALFYGTDSYYANCEAQTVVGVGKAVSPAASIEPEPTTPEPTTPEPTEPEASFITTEVAIIAAVAVATVIGIVSFWALRKRK